MDRINIDLGSAVHQRTALYGGVLDLVNGDDVSESTIADLKFSALFYRHIVVPDGFFHCRGPLLTYLSRLAAKGEATHAADPILGLLRAGVLVPVIRHGDALLPNWLDGEARGVVPGAYLVAARGEANHALALVDRTATTVAAWPVSMTPAAGSRFWSAATRALLDEASPYCIERREIPEDLPLALMGDWNRSQQLL